MYTPLRFEWDKRKADANIEKHDIDFDDALAIFERRTLVYPSYRSKEARWIAIGMMGKREIAVIFTVRGSTIRIILARRARKHERRAYNQDDARGSSRRKD